MRALRAARLWRAGISPTEFMRLRRAVHDLPAQVAIHGDLYDGNVLIIDDRSAALIDWEHAGVGPRYSDAIRFLTTLSRDEDAEYALECILRQAPTSDRELIGAQLRWLSLRHYADQITAEESAVSLQHREHIRQRWQQAMTWAAEIAPEPDQSAGTD